MKTIWPTAAWLNAIGDALFAAYFFQSIASMDDQMLVQQEEQQQQLGKCSVFSNQCSETCRAD